MKYIDKIGKYENHYQGTPAEIIELFNLINGRKNSYNDDATKESDELFECTIKPIKTYDGYEMDAKDLSISAKQQESEFSNIKLAEHLQAVIDVVQEPYLSALGEGDYIKTKRVLDKARKYLKGGK